MFFLLNIIFGNYLFGVLIIRFQHKQVLNLIRKNHLVYFDNDFSLERSMSHVLRSHMTFANCIIKSSFLLNTIWLFVWVSWNRQINDDTSQGFGASSPEQSEDWEGRRVQDGVCRDTKYEWDPLGSRQH